MKVNSNEIVGGLEMVNGNTFVYYNPNTSNIEFTFIGNSVAYKDGILETIPHIMKLVNTKSCVILFIIYLMVK